jgi:hypothetical protein
VEADAETLAEGLADFGSLYFNDILPLFSASNSTNIFTVESNLSNDLDVSESTNISSEILISGSGDNDSSYRVKGVQYNIGNDSTEIQTLENIPSDISDPIGTLSYMKGAPITDMSATNLSLTISDPKSLAIFPDEIIEIRGSTDDINDGKYLVDEGIDHGGTQEVIITRVKREIEDSLLDIVLDEDDCDACQIQDPYTCIAGIILPHWQGSFDIMDFRRFFERQLRLEAPGHVFLIICWISCEQMTEFEEKYKAWLVENAKKQKDYGLLSARLNALIDIVGRLRNVYPTGTLHDCEEDETLTNAIILDNSVLGNA